MNDWETPYKTVEDYNADPYQFKINFPEGTDQQALWAARGSERAWKKLVKLVAGDLPLCNCRTAYTLPIGRSFEAGQNFFDQEACCDGCEVNQSYAQEYVARKVLALLGETYDDD